MTVKDFFMLLGILLVAMYLFNSTKDMFKNTSCSDNAIHQAYTDYIFGRPKM